MNTLKKVIFASVLLIPMIGGVAMAQTAPRNLVQEEANRTLVIQFYDNFFNKHQVDDAAKVVTKDYIQHNPMVPNGKEAFVSYFKGFFKENPQYRARIVRSAVDGDIVWLHINATNGAKDLGKAVIDIFRVDNGKIVEHWDVIQDVLEKAANNNTMF